MIVKGVLTERQEAAGLRLERMGRGCAGRLIMTRVGQTVTVAQLGAWATSASIRRAADKYLAAQQVTEEGEIG